MGVSWVCAPNGRDRPSAARIEREFAGVVVWYGRATGAWWAMVGLGDDARLVEAVSPQELREAIMRARGWSWPR